MLQVKTYCCHGPDFVFRTKSYTALFFVGYMVKLTFKKIDLLRYFTVC